MCHAPLDLVRGTSASFNTWGGKRRDQQSVRGERRTGAKHPGACQSGSIRAADADRRAERRAGPGGLRLRMRRHGGECSCGGERAHPRKPQLVYAIGRLGVSFVSQARRDSIWRLVNGKAEGDLKPITDQSLHELFEKQPFQAQSVVWTLSRTEVPMYVIVPAGAFAAETYKWMVEEWADRDGRVRFDPGRARRPSGSLRRPDRRCRDPRPARHVQLGNRQVCDAPCAMRAARWRPTSATTSSIAR